MLERMGRERQGGLGQNARHFSKNSFCLKYSHSAFYLREEAHPTRKNQIYHSDNHVIVMTAFKEPTQSLFCKALMLMPIIQAWVGLRNLPLPECIPTYSQQRTPTDNVATERIHRFSFHILPQEALDLTSSPNSIQLPHASSLHDPKCLAVLNGKCNHLSSQGKSSRPD